MKSVFEKDLEFIQLLCNPEYLRWLYSQKYFEKREFMNYLNYLLYFKEPKYKIFLLYPQCISILEMILMPSIQEQLDSDEFYAKLGDGQFYLWNSRD